MTVPTPPASPAGLVVPSVPRSVSQVRAYARSVCEQAGLGQHAETLALLVSEVATNALVHGSGDVRVSVQAQGGRLRVEVGDDGKARPKPRTADLDAEGGRGLALVEALASSWGVDPRPPGKVVWFELG